MTTEVICHNEFNGKHRWATCPHEFPHAYLKDSHRHTFVTETRFSVTDDDRQIEIFDAEDKVRGSIMTHYPVDPRDGLIDFGSSSCEMIARHIVESLGAVECSVREDGRGGACVRA